MPLLEVCVDSPKAFAAAIDGGADRVELCAALNVGGLTPSAGLMALAAQSPYPTRVMIRPRVGSCVYSPLELDVMRHDIDAARKAGLKGVVFGASFADGRLDIKALQSLCEQAIGLERAIHRAFDLAPDPFEALEQVVELGFDTILTSGGTPRAMDGLDRLAELQARSKGRIEILCGGGVTHSNASEIVRRTGVTALHASCSAPLRDPDPRAESFGFLPSGAKETDRAVVAELKAKMVSLSSPDFEVPHVVH
jgi:copper homeostasis protein